MFFATILLMVENLVNVLIGCFMGLLRETIDLFFQGTIGQPWIISSVVISLSFVLMLVTFIGEAIRKVFDTEDKIYYE
jgi:ABC-type microcin C transport system permease subunit YejE